MIVLLIIEFIFMAVFELQPFIPLLTPLAETLAMPLASIRILKHIGAVYDHKPNIDAMVCLAAGLTSLQYFSVPTFSGMSIVQKPTIT